MNYIVKSIVETIIDAVKTNKEETMVKINGFEDINIYLQVAKILSEEFEKRQLSYEIKLAKSKKVYFEKKSDELRNCIDAMERKGWVADTESVTHFRNLHESNVLVLMGTEEEEDNSGLKNFYTITQEYVLDKIKKRYSEVFNETIYDFSDEDKRKVDRLYSDLFKFVAPDIYLLSSLDEEWRGQIATIDDFIDKFYETLPKWGLPYRKEEKIRSSKIAGRKNLFEKEYKFISRQMFKQFSDKKYESYENKLKIYDSDENKYNSTWDGWREQQINSYEEMSRILMAFIRGENIEENRKKLLKFDFSIIQDILDIKESRSSSKKNDKVYTYSGEPLIVFSKILLNTLANLQKEDILIAAIGVEIKAAEIKCPLSEIEDEEAAEILRKEWEKVCRHTNGVVDYINLRNFELSGNKVRFQMEKSDIFCPSCGKKYIYDGENISAEAVVTSASQNKKLSTIEIELKFYDEQNSDITGKIKRNVSNKFKWVFTQESDWLNNFSDLCSYVEKNDKADKFVPLSESKEIKKLFFSKSEEEFFDYYNENELDFSFNILEDINKRADYDNADDGLKKIISKFNELGQNYSEFIEKIYTRGFYSELTLNENSSLNELKNDYIAVGKMLKKYSVPEKFKWILTAYIYSFCIVEKKEVYTSDEPAECLIVPPWHPATLEKIVEKNKFFLDGCEEWWQKNNENIKNSKDIKTEQFIENLFEMSRIRSSLDLFPDNEKQYIGNMKSFGLFSIFGRGDLKYHIRLRDLIKKDAVFDDDFDTREIMNMSDDAKMLYGILKDYQKAFTYSFKNLSLVFVDPEQLQPIIAALYRFTQEIRKKYPDDIIDISLKILVKPNNKGGKNYLAYWIDEFFARDENIKIRAYINEWTKNEDIDDLLTNNNDIIFLMKLLKVDNLKFLKVKDDFKDDVCSCKFPIVYKPSPVSSTSFKTKRIIELSQPSFKAAFIHTQIVRKVKDLEADTSDDYIAVRELYIDREGRELVYKSHDKAYWVVCIDSGIDGALLKCDDDMEHKGTYSIIGFSTGKGEYGQYNLTVTARKSILDVIQKKLEKRLYKIFKWDEEKIKIAAKHCIEEAGSLDGISLLSAINMNDYKINEFMAYVLTSFIERKNNDDKTLKIIINLDSYEHWFSEKTENSKNGQKTRPDFLVLEAEQNEYGKLLINANVIECKLSKVSNSTGHKEKAIKQVERGIERLSYLFRPASDSIMRRYWYAQLYRALAFAKITFGNNTSEFQKISSGLRKILDGSFEINWSGKILGFWIDMEEEQSENITLGNGMECVDVSQCEIQKMLLGDDLPEVEFVNVPEDIVFDNEIADENSKKYEKEIEKELEEIYRGSNEQIVGKMEVNIIDDDVKRGVEEKTDDKEQENKEQKVDEVEDEIISKVATTQEQMENSYEAKNEINTYYLEDIRVYMGKNKAGEKIYWEFGNKNLANRHILITGMSGQGKTYCIQTMLYELSKSNISSVIFDYTEGFRPDQLEGEFKDKMDGKITQHIVKRDKVPINPFRRQEIEIAGEKMTETSSDVANRFANIITHVYGFGDQQFAAIFEATRQGIEKYGERMNMFYFEKELRNIQSEFKSAQSVLSKMTPFLRSDLFGENQEFDWSEVFYPDEAAMTVFQLTEIDTQLQIIITELMLWDAFYYTKKYGNKNKPFVVVLDEAQNLSHKDNSPSNKILLEGRKFGWSAWYATQSLKVLDDEEVTRLLNAPFKIYFKPIDDEIQKMSKRLEPSEPNKWVTALKNLKKGQCIISGDRLNSFGVFGTARPTVTDIVPFEERD